ncbi:UvrD-helicase domain-containing protein [Salinicoccus siamensis]|uniref:UvrD-helicase domain-containing protein n=1 Tax=Salinicoccus siamensis TaxID=381830 RepID=UPI00360B038F
MAAAAGSGKTTVLVERIIRKVLSGKYSIDEVFVATFTNMSARDMKDKSRRHSRPPTMISAIRPYMQKS